MKGVKFVALAALTAAVAAGCVPDAIPLVKLNASTAVPERMGLVLWVDGFDVMAAESLARAGRLPNIRKYLIDRGVVVKGAVTSLPTITYANNVSLTTGLFPGHHGVVANKWFDRNRLLFRNYGTIATYQLVDGDFIAPTVYERLADEFTVTILTPVRRGATRNIDNWASAGVAWYFGFQDTVNHLTTLRFELIAELANRAGRWPKLIWAYFAAPDTVAHAAGASGRAYTDILVDVDRQVGHICRSLQAAGLLEKTFITLISDHGFVDTPRHFDVAEYLRERLEVTVRSRPFGRNVPFEKRLAHFADARAVVVVNGDRMCSIHLRPGRRWWRRPTSAEIDRFGRTAGAAPKPDFPVELTCLPGVDLVTVRLGGSSLRVVGAGGAGVIERTVSAGRKLYRYRVVAGDDPLGYAARPEAAALMDGEHHPADKWLAATLATDRPDVVVQLAELNDSPRSGDVVLFARDGWDFGRSNRGGHGGLVRHEIIVPWIWAGPGLPAGASIRAARTVDLVPTMLELIGRSDAAAGARMDGVSIADRLRSAVAGRAGQSAADAVYSEAP